MLFHIYTIRGQVHLQHGATCINVGTEGAAIDLAVRTAQDEDALYSIQYWNPNH